MTLLYKVSGSTSTVKLAGAIAGAMSDKAYQAVELIAIGAAAVNAAVKATAAAAEMSGERLCITPTMQVEKLDAADDQDKRQIVTIHMMVHLYV